VQDGKRTCASTAMPWQPHHGQLGIGDQAYRWRALRVDSRTMMCIARGLGPVHAPDCGAPAGPSDFATGLICLSFPSSSPVLCSPWLCSRRLIRDFFPEKHDVARTAAVVRDERHVTAKVLLSICHI